jgi:multiple sugar transport system ATP-binding protein
MARVLIKNVDKVYQGGFQAVYNANIEITDKEFVVLVGPSGCGKTTTLRMVAGLEEITKGEIFIGERVVNNIPPKDRDVAMVFQNYALYPHMNTYENMAFGLKIRRLPKPEIDKRVKEAAKILHIEDQLDKKPRALSGGQRQRVAMGRAIVRKPKVFLFDEPLSNLDAKLRLTMRTEIALLHSKLQTTVIYVTHDQIEAMTLGTKIVVMKDGYIQQIDTPLNLYDSPKNKFVAGFIGSPPMNFFNAVIKKNHDIYFEHSGDKIVPTKEQQDKLKDYVGKEIAFGVRPEDLVLKKDIKNKFKATIDVIEPLGAGVYLYVSTGDKVRLVAAVDAHIKHTVGDTIELGINIEKCHFFEIIPDAETASGNIEEKCII